MAAEMLEKILEAEKTAKEKLMLSEAEAGKIIEKATEEGKKMIDDAKHDAERDSKQKLSVCYEKAKKLSDEKRSEAEKACAEMSERCLSKSDVCTQLVIDKLIS